MTFHAIPSTPGAEIDMLQIGASRLGIIIDRGEASLALHDGTTGARAQCPVDRAQLLAVAALATEAAALLCNTTMAPVDLAAR